MPFSRVWPRGSGRAEMMRQRRGCTRARSAGAPRPSAPCLSLTTRLTSCCVPRFVEVSTRAFERGALRPLSMRFSPKNRCIGKIFFWGSAPDPVMSDPTLDAPPPRSERSSRPRGPSIACRSMPFNCQFLQICSSLTSDFRRRISSRTRGVGGKQLPQRRESWLLATPEGHFGLGRHCPMQPRRLRQPSSPQQRHE